MKSLTDDERHSLAAAIRVLAEFAAEAYQDGTVEFVLGELPEPHRSLLAAILEQGVSPQSCKNIGSLGPGVRGFLVCEKQAGHADDLYHMQGEWRWLTGEVAERP